MSAPAEDLRRAVEILRRRLKGTTPAVWGRHDGWSRDGGYIEAVLQRDCEGHSVRPIAWVPTFSNDAGRTPARDRAVADADWMALMSPLTGEYLGQLLQALAEGKDADLLAQALARAIVNADTALEG